MDHKTMKYKYDHIEDQYDSRMSNKSIIDMIKKNHDKWKKNNMD